MLKIRFLLILKIFIGSFTTLSPLAYAASVVDAETPETIGPTIVHNNLEQAIAACKTIVQDNITWIEGLRVYWAKSENVEQVKERFRRDKDISEEKIEECIGSIFNGYKQEEAFWNEGLKKLNVLQDDMEDISNAPVEFLNDILEKKILQKIEYRVVKYGREHPELKYVAHLFPGNEENTKAQWEALEMIFDSLLPFASSAYQIDYREAAFDFIGYGRLNYFSGSLTDKSVGESTRRIDDFFEITSPVGHQGKLSLVKNLELSSSREWDSVLRRWFSELFISFKDSGFEIIFPNLPADKAQEYADLYAKAKAEYGKICARKKKRDARTGGAPVTKDIVDDRDLDALLAELGEESGSAKLPKNRRKKPASTKDVTNVMAAIEDVAVTVGDDKPISGAHGGAGGGSEAIKPTAVTVGDDKPMAEAHGGAGIDAEEMLAASHKAELAAKTLELAARLSYGGARPIRPYASEIKDSGLPGESTTMLANLLKVNGSGRYGDIKSINSYYWTDLVKLLKDLGFTKTTNNKFIYDSVRQIGLHYLHYDDRRLNGDLLKIMFRQLANIGFTEEYLTGLLGS